MNRYHVLISRDHRSTQGQLHYELSLLTEIRLEELGELVESNEIHPIVEVDVTGTWYPEKLFGLSCTSICVLAEFARMRLITGDEKQRTR